MGVDEVGVTVGVEQLVHERYVEGLHVQLLTVPNVLMVSEQPCLITLLGDFLNEVPAVNV